MATPGLPVIFITGIAGFIGSRIAHDAVAAGYQVMGVDDFSTGFVDNIPVTCREGSDWKLLDIADRRSIPTLTAFMAEAKRRGGGRVIVVHTACPAYDAQSHVLMAFVTQGVVVGTAVTLAAAIRVGALRFVHFSSMARYEGVPLLDHHDSVGYREDDPTGGLSPYGHAKVAAERLVRDSCEKEGMPWTILVPHNFIGVGQQYNNPARNVAAIFLNLALHDRPLFLHGDGEHRRVFTPWQDVAGPVHQMATDQNGRFDGLVLNLGPGPEYRMSVRELAGLVVKVTRRLTGRNYGREPQFVTTESLVAIRTAWCSDERFTQYFGRPPEPDYEQILTDMGQVVLAHEREFDYRVFDQADLGPEFLDPVYRDHLISIRAP